MKPTTTATGNHRVAQHHRAVAPLPPGGDLAAQSCGRGRSAVRASLLSGAAGPRPGCGLAYPPIIWFGSHSAIRGKRVISTMVTNMISTNGSEPLRTVVSGTCGATPLST